MSVVKSLLMRFYCVRKLRQRFFYASRINDEFFWDRYVREWEKSKHEKKLEFLGNEWTREETFLSLLEKHSNKTSNALEIGCGGGRITSKGVKLFGHVYAGDVSKEMLLKCMESITEENVSFHKLDGFSLQEFYDKDIDFVFSHDVFVHFSSLQVYSYLEEIREVLKPEGLGMISFYNFNLHFELFKKLSLSYAKKRIFPSPMRIHFITEEMIRRMLSDLRFKTVEINKEHFLVVVFQKQES